MCANQCMDRGARVTLGCPSTDYHNPHDWANGGQWMHCWGWTEEDEFFSIIDTEFPDYPMV